MDNMITLYTMIIVTIITFENFRVKLLFANEVC